MKHVILSSILSVILYAFPVSGDSLPPFKVGVVQSLTGIAAEDGNTVVHALKLAEGRINSTEQVKIELIIEDDQSVSKNASAAYEKLAAQGVRAVIGATWDFTTNPLLPLAGRQHTVLFNTSTLPECLTLKESAGYGFNNSITAADDAAPFAAFLQKRKPSSLTLLYVNNPWGEAQTRAYADLARAQGITVVDQLHPAGYDENDWRVLLPKVKAKRPGLIVLLVNKQDVEVILRRAREIGIGTPFFSTKNAYHAFKESRGREVFEGLCMSYPWDQLQRETDFVSEYKKAWNEEPRIFADNSYDALFILHKAWIDSVASKEPLNDSLRNVKWKGIVGEYSYSPEKSFGLGQPSLLCIRGGQFVRE